jgi:protein TonB
MSRAQADDAAPVRGGASETSPMRLPVILSLAGHGVVAALLILFAAQARRPPEPLEKQGIEVLFNPALAQPQAVLVPDAPIEPSPPPPTVAMAPPADQVPALLPAEAPPAPIAEVPVAPPDRTVTAMPPPPPKPPVRQKPKFVVRQLEPLRSAAPMPRRPAQMPPAAVAAAQFAALRAPAASLPGPDPAISYRALISAWFESHKRYPDAARERGEEGSVALRFRVDRSGRVVDYALLTSTGYADLDQGVEQMMRGAQLPPFPAGMTEAQIEIAVKIAFSLMR